MSLIILLAACAPGPLAEFRPGVIPGTGTLLFQAEPATQVFARYGTDGHLTEQTDTVPSDARAIPVVGLKVGETYTFEVVAKGASGAERSDRFEGIASLPSRSPTLELETWNPEQACDPGGYVLFTWDDGASSGVAITDREADLVWVLPSDDPERAIVRARPGADGTSILWAEVERQVRNGSSGRLVRTALGGEVLSETSALDLHHDFVEHDDGRVSWLGYEFSQPNNGATFELQVTDRIYATTEGSTEEPERVFSTLSDYPNGAYELPVEGYGGASLPGFTEVGHAASLAYQDGEYYLLWRWLDTMLRIDVSGELVWQWGGPFGDLEGTNPFGHAHFSDLWDGGVLIFDNGTEQGGASRLVEYRLDDTSFESVWELPGTAWEEGTGDVRRLPDCDHVLASWPSEGRIAELARDGTVVWEVRSDLPLGRVEFLDRLR